MKRGDEIDESWTGKKIKIIRRSLRRHEQEKKQ